MPVNTPKNPTPPAVTPQPAEAATARAAADHLAHIGETLHVDLQRAPEELLTSATARLNAAARQTALAGAELLAAKSACKHGEFLTLVARAGISQRQARYAMQIAAWLLQIQNANTRAAMLQCAPSKLRELARIDPAELDQFSAEQGADPHGLLALPQRALAAEVRKWRRAARNLTARNADLQTAAENARGAEAWIQESSARLKHLLELSARASNAMDDFLSEIQNWRQPPPKVHLRRVLGYTKNARLQIERMQKDLTQTRATCEQTLRTLETREK